VLPQQLVVFLRNDPLSPLQVEEVMVEDDEMANFTNLLLLPAILIGFQNLPEGFNAYRELRASFRLAATRILVAFSLMSLLGPACAIAGYTLLQDRPAIIGGVMILAAGGILYLTFEDIAPQARLEHRHAPPLGAVAGFLVGMLGHMLLGGV
jgi:ZIP family zinc transporter